MLIAPSVMPFRSSLKVTLVAFVVVLSLVMVTVMVTVSPGSATPSRSRSPVNWTSCVAVSVSGSR